MTFPKDRWALTDEYMKRLSDPKARVRIEGQLYYVDPNQEDLVVGDVVLDRGDGLWGVIDMIMPSSLNSKDIVLQAAVRCNGVAELGVPLTRLVRLKKFNEGNGN